jgi:pyruvate,orthophosphate dikinase
LEETVNKKYVYFFGDGSAEGNASMKWELGGKGANLAEMTTLGIPVPPGFTISSDACNDYLANNAYPDSLMDQIKEAMGKNEKTMGRTFGGGDKVLLVSVRSGAAVSMPGMMDTVLNLGLNDSAAESIIKETNNPRFVYDSYRRLIMMFADVVMGLGKDEFEEQLEKFKESKGVELDTELSADDMKEVVDLFKKFYKDNLNEDFPQDAWEQLDKGIKAVFNSWNNPRAITYRSLNNIADDMGTAVNVQTMVYGNLNEKSGSGVAFTRDPAAGENIFFGEYLMNAQGEDVVAGVRTPLPINHARTQEGETLEDIMPDVYKELDGIRLKLDDHYRDMQDIEFTIQDGKLYMLQTRSGKRTSKAAIVIALDYLSEGKIDEKECLMRIDPEGINQYLQPVFVDEAIEKAIEDGNLISKAGLPAGPGAAVGRVVFDADTAVEWNKKGEQVILVRKLTTPDDIHGMAAAQGIITAEGGMTSHAALVARGMGITTIVGCKELKINYATRTGTLAGKPLNEGDWISMEGHSHRIFEGKIETRSSEVRQVLIDKSLKAEDASDFKDYARMMELADKYRTLGVRTNADTPFDSEVARSLGAEGIGLTRTEHMFFKEDRIPKMQDMILSQTEKERRAALDKLLPLQQEDFEGIFTAMSGLPVTIRLLDPPLHEFLPHNEKDMKALADHLGVDVEIIRQKVENLHENNPMLGHRGCRLSVTYPEIAEMQVGAIIGAACECKKRGVDAIPEIMVPLVGHVNELSYLKEVIERIAAETMKNAGVEVEYLIGTMIEIPRAAVTADEIAAEAQFFSFGTNDLTQMGFGFSRDDIGSFIGDYTDKKVLPKDPFAQLDQGGIGKLVEMAVKGGQQTRPDIKLGICGEHGGEPTSIDFFHRVGLNYVSCSPFRVPIARLAAAQAAIRNEK